MQIPDELVPDVIRAVEHYAAYLRATNRDDRRFLAVAERLKRKPAAKRKSSARLSKIIVRVRAQGR